MGCCNQEHERQVEGDPMDIETDTGDLIYASRHSDKAFNEVCININNISISIGGGMKKGELNVIMCGGLACTFIDEMPVGVDANFDGYLFYDLEMEWFAGCDGVWREREKDLLINGDDIHLPTDKNIKDRIWAESIVEMGTLEALIHGNEIVLVPCKSHHSRIGGTFYVYQEFDWRWALGVKSKSGLLPITS